MFCMDNKYVDNDKMLNFLFNKVNTLNFQFNKVSTLALLFPIHGPT